MSDFLKPVFTATLRSSAGLDPNLRFRSLLRCLAALWLGEAIRSVSHLDLARYELMPWRPHVRTERSGPDCSWPGSLRLGFFGQPFFSHTRCSWQARAWAPTLRPSRHGRDQKTFSAGPRSFSFQELWFLGSASASGVQPVVDSRHGRIACKVSLRCTLLNR